MSLYNYNYSCNQAGPRDEQLSSCRRGVSIGQSLKYRTFAEGERKGEMETVKKMSFLHCTCQREMAILKVNFAYWRRAQTPMAPLLSPLRTPSSVLRWTEPITEPQAWDSLWPPDGPGHIPTAHPALCTPEPHPILCTSKCLFLLLWVNRFGPRDENGYTARSRKINKAACPERNGDISRFPM